MMTENHLELAAGLNIKFDLPLFILSSKYKNYLKYKLNIFCQNKGSENKAGSSFVSVSEKHEISMHEDRLKKEFESKRLWLKKTSGTSGARTNIYYDDNFYFEQLFLNIHKILYNFDPHFETKKFNIVSIMGNVKWGDELFIDPCNTGMAHFRLSFDERSLSTVSQFIKKINVLQPRVIILKPSLFLALDKCMEQLDSRFNFEVELVISSGQYLDSITGNLISERLNCSIYDCYIASESGLIGWRKISQDEFNIDRSNISEICVNKEGKILVTTNSNTAIGLVNYNIGDKGRILGSDHFILNEGRVVPVVTNENNQIIDLSRFDHVAFEVISASDYKIEIQNKFFNVYLDIPTENSKTNYIISNFFNTNNFKVFPIEEAPESFTSRYLIK